jgi:sulfur carrier protein
MNVYVNGEPRDLSEGATVSDLLQRLQLDPRHVAVECNLELAPRGQHDSTVLRDGDRLEIVTLVGGG